MLIRKNPLRRICCLSWVVLASVAGCGGGDEETPPVAGVVPVSGTVLLDGKPLEGASVLFIPAPGGPVDRAPVGASGVTGADGKYALTCGPESPGALPGAYRVVVSKFVMPDGSVPATEEGMTTPPEQLRIMGAKELVSWEHSDLLASTLVAEVPPSGGEILLEVRAAQQ